MAKYLTLKGEKLKRWTYFWLTVSENSVYGCGAIGWGL